MIEKSTNDIYLLGLGTTSEKVKAVSDIPGIVSGEMHAEIFQ